MKTSAAASSAALGVSVHKRRTGPRLGRTGPARSAVFDLLNSARKLSVQRSFRGDRALSEEKRYALDLLYQRVSDDLQALFHPIGLKVAA